MDHPHDNPAKNTVRSCFDASIRRFRPILRDGLDDDEALYGLYLPGQDNLEDPIYREHGIVTYAAEKDPSILRLLESARTSRHPRPREHVFAGELGDYVPFHVSQGRPRLSIINADFEGILENVSGQLLALFSIFPAHTGGLLAVTTFGARDGRTIFDGIKHMNFLNAAIDGGVHPFLDRVGSQWSRYTNKYGWKDAPAHTQLARDFGLLWRLTLGMGLVEQPQNGGGSTRAALFQRIQAPLHDIERRASDIRQLDSQHAQFYQVSSRARPGCPDTLAAIFADTTVKVFPITLERFAYKSTGNNRMHTWIIGFQRSTEVPQLWMDAAGALWQLYRSSTLKAVLTDGSIDPIHP